MSENVLDQIQIREAVDSDSALIYESWLLHGRHSSHLSWGVGNDLYFSNNQKFIRAILDRARVLIVCSKEDPDLIFAYCVYEYASVPRKEVGLDGDGLIEVPVVHYTFTKKAFRSQGIAKLLWTAAGLSEDKPCVVTAGTVEFMKGWPSNQNKKDYENALATRYRNAVYNPYRFFNAGLGDNENGNQDQSE